MQVRASTSMLSRIAKISHAPYGFDGTVLAAVANNERRRAFRNRSPETEPHSNLGICLLSFHVSSNIRQTSPCDGVTPCVQTCLHRRAQKQYFFGLRNSISSGSDEPEELPASSFSSSRRFHSATSCLRRSRSCLSKCSQCAHAAHSRAELSELSYPRCKCLRRRNYAPQLLLERFVDCFRDPRFLSHVLWAG